MVHLDRNFELEVAKVASRDPAMDAVAAKVLARAKAKASAHVKTGRYVGSLTSKTVRTRQGVHDRLVYSDDPDAHIIEFGHASPSGKWVEGQHILRDAARG